MKLTKLVQALVDPKIRFFKLNSLGLLNFMPDEAHIKWQYYVRVGKILNLKEPLLFNEKMQWLKLHDRREEYPVLADKYAVKQYVSDKIGDEYVIPLIGVWDNIDEINVENLPEKFVMKTTHGSGCVFVCKDKNSFDFKSAFKRLSLSLKENYYYHAREWPYKNIKPRIIAEKYMQNENDDVLKVYKVFNFNGEPFLIQVIQNDKTADESVDYYDTNWECLDIHQNFPNSEGRIDKPVTFDKMMNFSALLSKDYPFLRTDWYEINKCLFFSEYTFFSDAGFEPFYPEKWDRILGDKLVLPNAFF